MGRIEDIMNADYLSAKQKRQAIKYYKENVRDKPTTSKSIIDKGKNIAKGISENAKPVAKGVAKGLGRGLANLAKGSVRLAQDLREYKTERNIAKYQQLKAENNFLRLQQENQRLKAKTNQRRGFF